MRVEVAAGLPVPAVPPDVTVSSVLTQAKLEPGNQQSSPFISAAPWSDTKISEALLDSLGQRY